jgi:hypothetical protein
MSDYQTAREFAQFIKGLGFRAFVAGTPGGDGTRGYGFITDASGERVLSFQMGDQSLGGNYGPPSREAGTGWRLPDSIYSLKTADDVRAALNAYPEPFCQRATDTRGGWKYFTTLEQHLGQYGSSSKYEEI